MKSSSFVPCKVLFVVGRITVMMCWIQRVQSFVHFSSTRHHHHHNIPQLYQHYHSFHHSSKWGGGRVGNNHNSIRTSLITRFSTTTTNNNDSTTGKTKNKNRQQQLQQQLPRVLLKRNRQSKSFRDGSQLVFAGSVAQAPKSLQLADLVQVEVPVASSSDEDKSKKKNNNNNKGDDNNKDTRKGDTEQTQIVGWGVYNPKSMYRVRILCHSLLHPQLFSSKKSKTAIATTTMDSENDDKNDNNDFNDNDDNSITKLFLSKILTMQFQKAYQVRQGLGLPSTLTDTYRLVNGEGDGISGLAVDIIGNRVAVIMSSAAWCEIHQETILDCLQRILPSHYELVWKNTPSRLKQDGYEMIGSDNNNSDEDGDEDEDYYDDSYDESTSSSSSLEEEESSSMSSTSTSIIALENGIKYQTFPYQKSGQKTSVYCDQRENRWNLGQLCKDKHVLDLCCYHGGFSLNAAMQGATSVIGVDSSQDAIDTCNANAELNNLVVDTDDTDADAKIRFVRSDITTFMQNYNNNDNGKKLFDVIVLDPPKLAPSVSGLPKATRKYHSLNRDAIKLINEEHGGMFLTCTCSAAMTQKDGGDYFLKMVQQASIAAKREITLLRMHGAASCHTQSPISFPAGNYLSAALFYVHAKK